MPLPSDPSGPERSRERASWIAWVRQVAPVAVPLVLFVQIVAWGIAPALEKRASLLEKFPQVLEDWNLAQSELEQARREVLEEQLETQRLRTALERMASSEWLMERTQRPGPLAFPLLVERLNNRLSNESVLDRVQRLIAEATKAER